MIASLPSSASIPFFDGHNDFLLRLMKSSGLSGGLFAIFVPPVASGPPRDFKAFMAHPPYTLPMPEQMDHVTAQPVALQMAGLLHWMEFATPDDFKLCRSRAGICAAMAQDQIVGVMHMEGVEAIGPDIAALYLIHDIRLRSLGLVWSRPTFFGKRVPMSFPGSPDSGAGLTAADKDLVRLCDRLGILIDMSHLNEAGFDDVATPLNAPLVATRSNAHALCPSPLTPQPDRPPVADDPRAGRYGRVQLRDFLSERGRDGG